MSHVTTNIAGYSNASYASSSGTSWAAVFVKEKIEEIASVQSSTGFAQVSYGKTLELLKQIGKDYGVANWGGEGELPVDPKAIDNAINFLSLLPSKFQNPDVIPESSGAVAFEWRYGPFRSVIVSFMGTPRIEYSVLLSRSSASFGHCPFYGLIPLDVVRHLNSIGNVRAVS